MLTKLTRQRRSAPRVDQANQGCHLSRALVLPTVWHLNRDADLLITLVDLHTIFIQSAMARQAAWGRKKKVLLQRQTNQIREMFGFKDPSNGGDRFRLEQRWCEYTAKAPRTRQEK